MKILIFIIGKGGKVSKSIENLLKNEKDIEIIGGMNTKEDVDLEQFKKADVIIDFSSKDTLDKYLPLAEKFNKKVVIGTTNFEEKDFVKIKNASKNIPIFYSSNYSFAMASIHEMIKILKEEFKDSFIDIIEKHHILKKDAPSGTAKSLEKVLRNENFSKINIHSIRAANIIGEHIISFTKDDEIVEIKHICNNRDIFAKGAIKAAIFLINKTKNLYSMKDFFNERN